MRQLFCLLLISLPGFLLAQTFTINGTIQDEQGQKLPGAVVQLEYPWEEVIQSKVTTQTGTFTFDNIEQGGYQIRISFLSYETQVLECNITSKNYEFGAIQLQKSNLELNEFEVKEKAPLAQIIDDTTQYNASSFKTLKDASTGDRKSVV